MTLVHGSGFAIDTQGASSLAQGAATIAHTDYASAIFFNPALLNKLEGTQIEIGTTLFFPSSKFKSDITGKTFKVNRYLLERKVKAYVLEGSPNPVF